MGSLKQTQVSPKPKPDNFPCLWMQAGIVKMKLCKLDYRCPGCHYDRVMNRLAKQNSALKKAGKTPEGNRGKVISWKDKLMARPLSKRPCIHHMKGRIAFRICHNSYQCGHCDFDQYFDDQYSVHAVVKPIEALDVKGFKVPQGYYFHQGHTWVKIEPGAVVRVGIDDFALRLLGPLDRIEAPLMGREVRQDLAMISLYRGENLAKVLSPVTGVVTAVNPELRETGWLANQNPYSNGWVMMVKPDNLRHDLKNLMIHDETREFMGQQIDRLYDAIEEMTGPLSADGGCLGDDILGHLPSAGWRKLTKIFLKT